MKRIISRSMSARIAPRARGLGCFAAGVLGVAMLAGCGEATTGDDPTARAPQAPYAAPGSTPADGRDLWRIDTNNR